MSLNKEIKYLKLAGELARLFSKDQSTQVGALFLHPSEYTILSAGYNGIPRGCNDDVPERQLRPAKYSWTEHAERNAIYNALRATFRGCHVICAAPLAVDDVRAIISVGAAVLFTRELPKSPIAHELLTEAGVNVQALPENAVPGEVVFLSESGKQLAHARDDRPDALDSAVREAIYEAARPVLDGSTVVVGPLPPCDACARALATVGVRRVVSNQPTEELNARWGASFVQTRGLFTSLGIELVEI